MNFTVKVEHRDEVFFGKIHRGQTGMAEIV